MLAGASWAFEKGDQGALKAKKKMLWKGNFGLKRRASIK